MTSSPCSVAWRWAWCLWAACGCCGARQKGGGEAVAREYTPEVKAAVMAALLAGQSISSVAREYQIPKGTVKGWQTQAGNPLGMLQNPAGVATVATQNKQEEILQLMLDLVIAQLKSQIALADHSGDKKWLTIQDASAVAMLLGVSNDKVFRLLEAMGRDGAEVKPTES